MMNLLHHPRRVAVVIMMLTVLSTSSAIYSQVQQDTTANRSSRNSSIWLLSSHQTEVNNGDSTSLAAPSIRAALMIQSGRLDSLIYRIANEQRNPLGWHFGHDSTPRADRFQLDFSVSRYWKDRFQNLLREKLLKDDELSPYEIDHILGR